ncbi:MAG: single-stranded DNA-binding protein [Patescibacteria group bacterium]|nr:single-stranded DNA-binding protein [Patescibacteria group bacterium]
MANSLNLAQIIGNLTRDPELRQTPNGQSVCTVGVATNRSWTDQSGQKQEQAEFHNVVVWGKLAEICAQYLKKGQKVYFAGRMQTREWEGQDGQKRRTTEIVADQMIMLSSGKGGEKANAAAVEAGPAAGTDDDIEKINVNDLPF